MTFASSSILLSYPIYRISAQDSNRLAIVCDETSQRTPFIQCIEIFDPLGRTPPNRHNQATEQFFVLYGRGRAQVGSTYYDLFPGATLVVHPGQPHELWNSQSPERLYLLTTMVPDEDFSSLIRAGVPAQWDPEDLRILTQGRGDLSSPVS
ncbi:MAG: cupin domain-containing protein [Firmicutes bacterium]|nr:cupin domain-containing protein [Bacillota bacterium]